MHKQIHYLLTISNLAVNEEFYFRAVIFEFVCNYELRTTYGKQIAEYRGSTYTKKQSF